MAEQKPMHPCEWFSQVAEPVLDSCPKLDLQFGGFFWHWRRIRTLLE